MLKHDLLRSVTAPQSANIAPRHDFTKLVFKFPHNKKMLNIVLLTKQGDVGHPYGKMDAPSKQMKK